MIRGNNATHDKKEPSSTVQNHTCVYVCMFIVQKCKNKFVWQPLKHVDEIFWPVIQPVFVWQPLKHVDEIFWPVIQPVFVWQSLKHVDEIFWSVIQPVQINCILFYYIHI
jgi:hypothetical protein